MTTKKVVRRSSKTQKAGRRYKKFTNKRKGGILNTVASAMVPFGLVALKRAYSNRVKRTGRGSRSRSRRGSKSRKTGQK